MDISNLIRFLIAWGPTILFVLIVGIAVILGFIRGARKSFILTINSLVIFALCFTCYLFLINIKAIDELTFSLINKILAIFNTSLGQLLNIGEANSLKEVLTLILPEIIGYGDILNSLLTDNGAYLNTIVNLSYNLVFAAIMFIIYVILDLIVYLIYIIFFNERRHHKRQRKAYLNNANAIISTKKRGFGALIGLCRGLCGGILTMGFIGSLFFIVGGDGNHEGVDVKFSDKNINAAYTAFDAIGSYGDTGILKVLGSIKNKDEVPYYLLAFDLVVSGNYKDEENNQSNNIIFRDELAAYTNLTRDTVKLLFKYDYDGNLVKLINGDNKLNAEDVILKIFADEGFNKEFKTVIDNFEAKTYLINLTLGLINAIVCNIDSLELGVTEEVKAVIDILFNGENSIKVKDIVEARDLNNILKLVLDIIGLSYNSEGMDVETYNVNLIDIVLPYIRKLTLSSNDEIFVNKLNTLLSECYGYLLENSFDDLFDDTTVEKALKKTSKMTIDWYRELNLIIDNFKHIYSFYNDIYLGYYEKYPEGDDLNLFIEYIPTNSNYLKTSLEIVDLISSSNVIAVFINETGLIDNLKASLPVELSDNIPNKLDLANIYDENGYLLEFGELHSLLKNILDICSDSEARVGLLELINYDFNYVNIEDIEKIFAKFDANVINKLADSKFLSYAITGVLDDIELVDNTKIFVPDDCVIIEEVEGKSYRRLKKQELVQTFSSLADIIGIFKPYIDTGVDINDIENLINDSRLISLINENKLFEGTFANIIINQIQSVDTLILVDNLADPNLWIEYHEINNILNAIYNTGIKISEILNSELSISTIKDWNLNEYSLYEIFNSKLLKTNISYVLTNTVSDIVVPDNVLELSDETINNVKIKQIQTYYMVSLLQNINMIFDDNEQIKIDEIINNRYQLFNNPIIECSVTYHLFMALKENRDLIIPKRYINICDKKSLENPNNLIIQNKEALNLLTALRDVLYIYNLDDLNNLTYEYLSQQIFNLNNYDYNHDSYKIDICYKSLVLSSNITKVIDDNFDKNFLKDEYKGYLKEDDIYVASDIRVLLDTLENYFYIYRIEDFTEQRIEEILFGQSYYINYLYNSRFLAYIISSCLESALVDYVDNNMFKLTYETDLNFKKAIKKEEVINIFNALKVIDIYSFNDLNNYDINIRFKELLDYYNGYTRLEHLYKSTIIKGFIAKQLDDCLISTNFLKVTEEAKEKIGENVSVYKMIEIEYLIRGLIYLNINSLTDINIDNIRVDQIYYFLDSTIFRDATTNILLNTLDFVLLKSSVSNNIITRQELSKLLDILIRLNINKLTDFNFNNIRFDNNFVNDIYNQSDILAYTLSTKLIKEDYLLITSDLVELNYDLNNNQIYKIKYEDMHDLQIALQYDFKIDYLHNFELIIPNNLYYSLKSKIILNTISHNLNLTINNSETNIYVTDLSSDLKYTVNNLEVRVLKESEASNLIDGLRAFNKNNFDVNFDITSLKKLNESSLKKILESEVLYHACSDLITSTGLVEGQVSKTVYDLKTNKVTTKYFVDKETLIRLIKYLPF